MATAKKAATKKAAVKKSTRKVAAKKAPARKPKVVSDVKLAPADIDLIDPPETPTKAPRKVAVRKTPVTRRKKAKAQKEFLYSIRTKPATDDLGLDEPSPTSFTFVGPFSSEAEATSAALEEAGGKKDIEIVVFRDFRRGTPQTKVRLVS